MSHLRLLVCGNPTIDEIVNNAGRIVEPGGAVLYAAGTATFFKTKVSIVGNVGPDYPSKAWTWLKSHQINAFLNRTDQGTTKFQLSYTQKGRKLRLLSDSPAIRSIPSRKYDGVHLGPIFGEINRTLVLNARKRTKFLSADLQGFVRDLSSDRIVRNVRRDLRYLFHSCDLVKASSAEAETEFGTSNMEEAVNRMVKQGARHAIVTLGKKGCILGTGNGMGWMVPAFTDSKVIDPTGAGDVLLGAWLCVYLRTLDPVWSASVGSALASLTSRKRGLAKFVFSRRELFKRTSWIYNHARPLELG